MSQESDCSKNSRMLLPLKNMGVNRLQLGMTIWFASSFFINSSDETLRCESSWSCSFYSIKDGVPRICHVIYEEEASCNAWRLISIERMRCHHTPTRVHQAWSNFIHYNSLDERLILKWFKTWIVTQLDAIAYPPPNLT